MRVKIIKCGDDTIWYYHSIGKEFEVIPCDFNEHLFIVPTRALPNGTGIFKNDCEEVSVDKNTQIEPELNTFQGCWNAIMPDILLEPRGINHMNLPSIKSAKQIQAAIKLFVIHAALVRYYIYNPQVEHWEVCFHDDIKHGIYPVKVSPGICTQFIFPSEALAQKAIDIDISIWREYYGLTD